MEQYKISILTPFKNAERYILETAQSIFSQTYTNWEWILVNDHSEEKEEEILAPFLSDSRVFLYKNNGSGIINALCLARKKLIGEFITRMDADDIMPANKLELLLETLKKETCDISTGKVQYFSVEAISDGYKKYETWLNARVENQDFYAQIYRECSIASANWLMKTEIFDACGGFENLIYPEDYDLLFRFYANNLKIGATNTITHLWRDHSLRTSKNSRHYDQKHFFELKVKRFIDLEKDYYPLILNGSGQKARLIAKKLKENNILFDWISHEAEKYPDGIFGHEVLDIMDLYPTEPVTILNATLISEEEIIGYYGEGILVKRVINF